jgi:hypothetical protein
MRCARAFSLLAVLVPVARAQTLHPLVSEGDIVAGVGAVTVFNPPFVEVNDAGTWAIAFDTNGADVTQDYVLLRNGVLDWREGMSLAQPPGSMLDKLSSFDLADDGSAAAILSTRAPTTDGVYWNLAKIAGTFAPIPSPILGANSRWVEFDVIELNAGRQVLVLGDIDNTAMPAIREDALVRYVLDAQGEVLQTTVLATEGQFNAALGAPLTGLAGSPNDHVLALNERGDFITLFQTAAGTAVLINAATIVAQELTPSSVGGRWRTLDLSKVAINDFGEHVLSGVLEGGGADFFLIEKDGQEFARSGDVLPALSVSPLAPGRATPILLANTGRVFWQAQTLANDVAYMRDHEPIVKAGATLLDGNLVLELPSNENAFAISPDGRFFLGRIEELQTVGRSSVLVDFGLVVEVPGCVGNTGVLAHASGAARVGETFWLAMDSGQEPGVLTTLTLSSQARMPGSDCGTPTIAGEVLISLQHRVATTFLAPWDGVNPSTVSAAVPNDPALVDLELHAQGLFQDVTGPTFQAPRLTNALRIQIGAP